MKKFNHCRTAGAGLQAKATTIMAALLLSAPAFAADIPARAYAKASITATSAYDWSGFYAGVQAGGAFQRNTATTPGGELLAPINIFNGNVFAGGLIGYNYQAMRNLVLGVEGDFALALGGRGISTPQQTIVAGVSATAASDPKWMASIAARAGLAMDNWLLYGKAGIGFMNVNYTATAVNGAGTELASQTLGTTRSGLLLGAGLEYAWSQNITTRLEYNYLNFGSQRMTYNIAGINNADFDSNVHVVKVGLAYKFGGF